MCFKGDLFRVRPRASGLEGPEEQAQEEVWLEEEGSARLPISVPRGAEWESGICQLEAFILWEEEERC